MRRAVFWATALVLALAVSVAVTAATKALADWLGVPFVLVGGGL